MSRPTNARRPQGALFGFRSHPGISMPLFSYFVPAALKTIWSLPFHVPSV
jgi:hypothetical protein